MILFELLEPMLWNIIMSFLETKDNNNLFITFSILAKKNDIFDRHANIIFNKLYLNTLEINPYLKILVDIYKNQDIIDTKKWMFYYTKFFNIAIVNGKANKIYEALLLYEKIFKKKPYFKIINIILKDRLSLYNYGVKINKIECNNNVKLIIQKLN